MSKSKKMIKFFLKELEDFIERLEAHIVASAPAKVEHQSEHQSEQPAPAEQNTQTEEEIPMLIKSTDGIGPDIETSDTPNPGLTAEKNDGRAVDQSDAVDTNKINLPTPIGALAPLSVNGPIQDGSDMAEDKPVGDSSPMETEQDEPSTEHQDIDLGDAPAAEPLPVDENATPKANTKVTSTFEPIDLKADSPAISPLQPDPEALSLPVLDIEKKDDSSDSSDSAAPADSADSEETESGAQTESDVELAAKVEPTADFAVADESVEAPVEAEAEAEEPVAPEETKDKE